MASRFAPTTSGRAHPGTLLSFLLSWLDARTKEQKFILRLEDIDPSSVRAEFVNALLDDLMWFGLDWDEVHYQSKHTEAHYTALDTLGDRGLLYECICSRSQIAETAQSSESGGFVYPGTCRHRLLPKDTWRSALGNIRLNTQNQIIKIIDEDGTDLSQNLEKDMGDPLLARRDKSISYMLAVVVDDINANITRIIRGRDIAPSTATQVFLWNLLGSRLPIYRHHFLLLENHKDKLSKLHKSVDLGTLSKGLSPKEVRKQIANLAGIPSQTGEISELKDLFSWSQIRTQDLLYKFPSRA